MQLGSEPHIPDGLLATLTLAENSRQGLATSARTSHPGFAFAISSTALDFQLRCAGTASDPVAAPMLRELDREAESLNISRPAVIKTMLREALDLRHLAERGR